MHFSYIAIGSNLGDRAANIANAIECISSHPQIHIRDQSRLYQFPALTSDNEPQPDYLNGVIGIQTGLEPLELLNVLQSIERKLGRPEDHGKWQPRTLDLDILLYDDVVMSTPRLVIPHPEMHKRMFVLRPLCDIAPTLKHPTLKISIEQCLE